MAQHQHVQIMMNVRMTVNSWWCGLPTDLVEVANAWDVVLAVLAKDRAVRIDDNCSRCTRVLMQYCLVPAVFQMVSWWASSRSRMGEMTTMPYSRAYCSW